MTITIILIIALPLAAIQFGLLVLTLRDLMNPQRRVRGNRMAWLMVVLFVHFIGPTAYLLVGRHRGETGGKRRIAANASPRRSRHEKQGPLAGAPMV